MKGLVPVLVFAFGFYFALANVTIKELRVPKSLNNEDPPENITLDCVYEVTGDRNIVVKWYFNTTENMIYQWIPSKEPATLGMFKDIVDISYRATEDLQTMYRALHITQISPNITGVYFCKVSADLAEAWDSKKLVVYEPPEDGLILEHDEDNNTLSCYSSGLLPVPELTLCVVDVNETYCENDGFLFEPVIQIVADEDNRYNISGFVQYNETLLSDGAVFYCNLTIPDTDFYIEESSVFESDTIELDEGIVDIPEWFYEFNATANTSEIDDNYSEDFSANLTSTEQDNSAASVFLTLPLVLTTIISLWMNS